MPRESGAPNRHQRCDRESREIGVCPRRALSFFPLSRLRERALCFGLPRSPLPRHSLRSLGTLSRKRERGKQGEPYLFFFLNRTPGASPLVNSTPAVSSARTTAAIVGSCFASSASILVIV